MKQSKATNESARKFADEFVLCRKEAKLTQRQLAQKLGCNHTQISHIEAGRRYPVDLRFLRKCVEIFNANFVTKWETDKLWEYGAGITTAILTETSKQPIVQKIERMLGDPTFVQKQDLIFDLETLLSRWQTLQVADLAFSEGNWKLATQKLESLEDQETALVAIHSLRRIKMQSRIAYYRGNMTKAKDSLESALGILSRLERLITDRTAIQLERADILTRLGDVHRRSNAWSVASAKYEQSKEIYPDKANVAKCLTKLAGTYLFQGLAAKGLNCAMESRNLYEELNDWSGIQKAKQHMAWSYSYLGKWNEAADLHREALERFEASGKDNGEIAKAKRYYADVLRMQGDLEGAKKQYMEALRLAELRAREGDEELLLRGTILLGLGKIYTLEGEYSEAETKLTESMNIHESLHDDLRLAKTLNALGKLHIQQRNVERAAYKLEEAKTRAERSKVKYYDFVIAVNQAELLVQNAKYSKANQLVENTMGAADHSNITNFRPLARIQIVYARSLLAQGVPTEAMKALCEAFRLANAFNEYLTDEVFQATALLIEGLLSGDEQSVFYKQIGKFWKELSPNPSGRKVKGWLAQFKENARRITTRASLG